MTSPHRRRVYGDKLECRSLSCAPVNELGVDVIVCWRHGWRDCPKQIEIIELSRALGDAEQIDAEIKTERKLTAWQAFCQQKDPRAGNLRAKRDVS